MILKGSLSTINRNMVLQTQISANSLQHIYFSIVRMTPAGEKIGSILRLDFSFDRRVRCALHFVTYMMLYPQLHPALARVLVWSFD